MTENHHSQTYAHLISSFTTFLIVAIHTILYERRCYPLTTFLSARKYNFPVRQSRHPKVCQWISDAAAAVETELLKGTVSRIALVIIDPNSYKPLERFIWDVERLPLVPLGEIHTPFVRGISSQQSEGPKKNALLNGGKGSGNDDGSGNIDLDQQLRAVMSQLSTISSRLKPIPEGCTFTVSIELKDEADPPIGHPQPWVPSQPSLQKMKSLGKGTQREQQAKKGADLGGVRTVPLRTVDAGELTFEMWIEEGQAKSMSKTPSQSLQSSGTKLSSSSE